MFGAILPFKKIASKEKTNISLRSIPWDSAKCTNNMLQGKLIESIVKFLNKKEMDLVEILDFSEQIRKKKGKYLSPKLQKITTILHDLKEKMQKKEIIYSYQNPVTLILDKTQQIVTRKSFQEQN